MSDAEKRIDAMIYKYIDYFGMGIPEGFELTELKDPDDPDEWEKVLSEAIEYNEPFNYCCEGVFTDEELAEENRKSMERKARISKAKSQIDKK